MEKNYKHIIKDIVKQLAKLDEKFVETLNVKDLLNEIEIDYESNRLTAVLNEEEELLVLKHRFDKKHRELVELIDSVKSTVESLHKIAPSRKMEQRDWDKLMF